MSEVPDTLTIIAGSHADFLVCSATGRVLTARGEMPALLANVVRVDLDEYRRWDPTARTEIHVELVDLIRETPLGELRDRADAEARAEIDADLALEQVAVRSQGDH